MADDPTRLSKPSGRDALRRKLRELVPGAFSEGELDGDRLERLLGQTEETSSTERYELNWVGKEAAKAKAQTPSEKTVVPKPEGSLAFGETDNHFIEGENLQTLKTLQRSYNQRVKMIYIDPPYNTGQEFIYNDNFHSSKSEYERDSGQRDENGDRLVSNPESNGRYHSDWLSMMYPRLFLSRNLLRNDGGIFVSIDHHEYHNLRHLMDEIFGEDNYVGTLVWKRRTPDARNAGGLSIDHEYVVVYQRTDEFEIQGVEKSFEKYTNPDGDPRGPWVAGDLKNSRSKKERPTMFYEITDPETGIVYEPDPSSVWRLGKETMEQYIEEGRVLFPDDGDGVPKIKRFQSELNSEYKPLSSWIETTTTEEDVELYEQAFDRTVIQTGMTGTATRELKSLFGYKAYDFPKSVDLISKLIEHTVEPGDTVLDFFAGSGTTGHAVMELNAQEEYDPLINFVLVQLDDELDEPRGEESTHAEVCQRRLELAAEALQNGDDGRGLGFNKFSLADSRFDRWGAPDTAEAAETAIEDYLDQPAPRITDVDAALVEVQLLLGYPLDTDQKKLGDETFGFEDDGRRAVVTFKSEVSYDWASELEHIDQSTLVCPDSSLSDTAKDQIGREFTLKTI